MSLRTSSAGLLSSLLLAALAGACGGVAPSSSSQVDPAPPSTSPPGTSTAVPDEPATTSPPPKYPVGPYTGTVATTDVSVLYPLAASSVSPGHLRPLAIGDHGALLPKAIVDSVLEGRRLDDLSGDSTYDALRLVSIRLDPCSPRGVAGALGACTSEVRLVFQELYDDATNGTSASDGALHVVYDVAQPELVTMLRELLTLKKANGDLGLLELAPHPILAAQGLAGPFAQGLRDILLEHVGDDRIARVTFFDHQGTEGDSWSFGLFERKTPGSLLVAESIPSLDVATQTFSGTSTFGPLASSFAYAEASRPEDDIAALVGSSRPQPTITDKTSLEPALEAALRLQNPTLRNAENTDCVSCHLAEGARRVGVDVFGLPTPTEFTHTRSLARVDQRTSVTNVHAFGYLRNQVSIMQRTANESVLVADRMAALLAPPK